MSGRQQARLAALAGILLALAACDEANLGDLFKPKPAAEAVAQDIPQALTGKTAIIEAPEVFDATATALWDGRPSLGKVWVAYEGADPTNVIIRNEANGKSVEGALYRRERFFPGPPFQMSSDAAAALGILAGSPTEIHVTALKAVAVAPQAPAPVEEEIALTIAEDSEPVHEPEPEPEADAHIALPAATPADPIAAAAAAIAVADPDGGEVAVPETDTPPAPPRRPLTEGPNAPSPRLNPVFEAPAPPPVEEPEPVALAAPIEATAIAATAPVAEAVVAAPAPEVSTLKRPFIQVGLFSEAENAENTVRTLAGEGIIAITNTQAVGDNEYTRVIVGPARNIAERAALLRQIRKLGFGDAFFVKG